MGENTKIEWAHHTFNAWTGCAKVSPGCAHCYAESWSKRSGLVVWGENGTRRRTSQALWREVLRWNERARQTGERERVFVNSLSDWAEDRPELVEIRKEMFALIEKCEALDFLLLSKRPENFWRFLPWCSVDSAGRPEAYGEAWKNVWLGVTAENQEWADRRIPLLLETPAAVRFISAEPLLGAVDLSRFHIGWFICPDCHEARDPDTDNPLGSEVYCLDCENPYSLDIGGRHLDWVIAGGESGHGARPMHPDWARSLRDQCQTAGLKFLFKQWGNWLPYEPVELHLWRDQTGEEHDGNCLDILNPETGEVNNGWDDGMWAISERLSPVAFRNVGKKAAGRLLDGREWNEMPEVRR